MSKETIQYEADFSKNAIEGITKKLPNIVLATAFILGLVIFTIIASHEIISFAKYSYWLAGATFVIILFFDIIFTLSSVVTAIFLKVKSYFYAGLFLTLTIFGFAFTIWRSLEFTKSMKIQEEEVEFALKVILVFACILRAIFSEGGAFMLFAFSFKEERNSETSEMRNSETGEKQAENDVSQETEENTQGKIEDLPLPKSIKKTGDDKYSINNELPKTYEQLRGNMRANRSAKNKFYESGHYRKARNSEVLENYYNYILETIDFQNKELGTVTWNFFPNGSLADDTEPKKETNGHKLEPEFFQ